MDYEQKKRYDKIYKEKFYLLDVNQSEDTPENYDFAISGSTANVYHMMLDQKNLCLRCDCPDATSWALKRNVICKHCCFLLVRVIKMDLKVLEDDIFSSADLKFSPQVFWQIRTKVDKMAQSKIYAKDIINTDFIKKYKKIKGKNDDDGNQFTIHKTIDDDDECIICFDTLDGSQKDNIIECPDCHNLLHKFCMEKWLSSGNKTCVYCRSNAWTVYFKVKDDGDGGSGLYKNLLI